MYIRLLPLSLLLYTGICGSCRFLGEGVLVGVALAERGPVCIIPIRELICLQKMKTKYYNHLITNSFDNSNNNIPQT